MTLFNYIRKKRAGKFIAVFLAINLLAEIFMPTLAMALNSGASQPEMQSFEPAGTSDMVDLFTGDFNYNISLFDLPGPNGGYPFNMAYHSGITMDQEASWVGLGWNINPGAINRDKRGLPDDFNGDVVRTELDMAPNVTYGVVTGGNLEILGGDIGFGGGLTIYNNNFKGIGYSLDQSMHFTSKSCKGSFAASLDSQEGVGGNANASTRDESKAIGIGFNSQRGLSISGSVGIFSGSHTFAEKAFMPSFTPERTGINLQTKLKIGGSVFGVQGSLALGGYYRTEGIKNKTKDYSAFGYNYLEHADPNAMMDFNREKDGIIRKETPNLASPNLTFDTYMATGQGYAGSYRAHRNDVGHLHDPYSESKISGGSIGVDLGFGYDFQLGIEASENHTIMTSGDWFEDNGLVTGTVQAYNYLSDNNVSDPSFENLYYKMKGEMSSFNTDELNSIGGELAVRAFLEKDGNQYTPKSDKLEPSYGAAISSLKNQRANNLKRIRRNNSIQPITNAELLDGSTELLNEFKIKYRTNPALTDYKFTQNAFAFDRTGSTISGFHNAGFSCVNADGLRYVYALPAYNITEEEITYTCAEQANKENVNHIFDIGNQDSYKIDKTEKFFSRTVTPSYAHAYLLTSVLGADYVDVTGNGVTDDDYGYWVKFNYVKTSGTSGSNKFRWRTPYEGGVYLKGKNNTVVDDKVMFNYGEKEMWYLASAETKSHIAIFKLSQRSDGRAAKHKYSTEPEVDPQHVYELDEINLFSKADYNSGAVPLPLKTVHFEYRYDLCPSVNNNLDPAIGKNGKQGKLTLTKVWFTYQNNTRGSLSPYTFEYNALLSNGNIDTDNNPYYSMTNDAYNRWGGYRASGDFFRTKNLPYVTQFEPGNDQSSSAVKQAFKEKTDQQAAVWTLKKIGLPTGGAITINYESDDYAYVQYKKATQMFQILSMGDRSHENNVYADGDKELGGANNKEKRRVYFKLETPIDASDPEAAKNKMFNDYVSGLREADGTYPMYFRIYSDLRNGIYEDVTGYCDLQEGESGVSDIMGGKYTVGFVTLKLISNTGSSNIDYHPFAIASWQFLRVNEPQLLTAFGKLEGATDGSSDKDKAVKIASLGSVIPAAMQVFTGYRRYAFNHNWGRIIDPAKSFIRLNTPDRIKFGGGLRVKKITYTDNWNAVSSDEKSNQYGQVYDYTITEGTGTSAVTYSSGVAQYEPMIGGDEIALRHPKNYIQNLPFQTDNNLFFEYPVNESLYPGPSVGYSKVTVQSIASRETMPGGTKNTSIPTSGIVEYAFYTSKDFPVITDETDNMIRTRNIYVPIPLIGEIIQQKLFAAQGYAISVNNMNGILKSVTNYAKNALGKKVEVPVSSVSYHYKSEQRQYDGHTVNVLLNRVPAIINESLNATSNTMLCNKADVIVGEEYDFFTDSRQSHIFSEQSGAALNILLYSPYAGIPIPWPATSENTSDLRTFVTNKIISKTGILDMVIATDGQSVVKTENKLFDAQTGAPLLTVVTNDFDKPVYNYTHPANWEYDGMGAAAKNYRFKFCAKIKSVNTTSHTFTIQNEYTNQMDLSTAVTKIRDNGRNDVLKSHPINKDEFQSIIAPGDELIIQNADQNNKYKATLLNNDKPTVCVAGSSNNILFHYATPGMSISAGEEFYFTIVRSGRRNQLMATAGAITALMDPTDNANRSSHTQGGVESCMASEVAALLNELLLKDNNIAAGQQLPLITYPISKNAYPLLGSKFTQVEVKISTCGGLEFIESLTSRQYELTFTYLNESGVCSTVTCPCIAPVYNVPSTTEYADYVYFEADPSFCGVRSVTTKGYVYSGSISCLNNLITPYYTKIKDVISASSSIYKDFSNYNAQAYVATDNLYTPGKMGIWKPYINYYYKDERVDQRLTANVKLSHDGVYKGNNTDPLQNEFYLFNWQPAPKYPNIRNWTQSTIASKYDKNSNPVETGDILSLYSGVRYGYNGQLPIIQAKNARQNELFFESLEDSSSYTPTVPSSFQVTNAIAHTGKKSLKVLADAMIINDFKPGARKYAVSLWISKNSQPSTYANTSDDIGIIMVYYDATNAVFATSALMRPSGNVIEKWQRIEGEFTPPTGTVKIAIQFKVSANGTVQSGRYAYVDDIRVFPFNATVKTSVYDPVNFRIAAVLDDNNFATIYNYDEEGKLYLMKKETTAGIKTITETRTHTKE
jgi:hypothetical protein